MHQTQRPLHALMRVKQPPRVVAQPSRSLGMAKIDATHPRVPKPIPISVASDHPLRTVLP